MPAPTILLLLVPRRGVLEKWVLSERMMMVRANKMEVAGRVTSYVPRSSQGLGFTTIAGLGGSLGVVS